MVCDAFESMTVAREMDVMICNYWSRAGAVRCGELVDVPQAGGGSHRTLNDYIIALIEHWNRREHDPSMLDLARSAEEIQPDFPGMG